jgi:hypothetical protein
VTSPWHQLGNGPERQGYQPSDRVFSQELVPGKIYTMQPVVVSDVTAPIDSSPAVAGSALATIPGNSRQCGGHRRRDHARYVSTAYGVPMN